MGFRVVMGSFGGYYWVWVVMRWTQVVLGGYWWLWLVMVWYWVVTGGYHWLF